MRELSSHKNEKKMAISQRPSPSPPFFLVLLCAEDYHLDNTLLRWWLFATHTWVASDDCIRRLNTVPYTKKIKVAMGFCLFGHTINNSAKDSNLSVRACASLNRTVVPRPGQKIIISCTTTSSCIRITTWGGGGCFFVRKAGAEGSKPENKIKGACHVFLTTRLC